MMNTNVFKLILVISFALIAGHQPIAAGNDPYLYILGVAQDAGYPQSGCYEKHCMVGWKNPERRRGAVSIGLIDPLARKKYMFDATPDFPMQLASAVEEDEVGRDIAPLLRAGCG